MAALIGALIFAAAQFNPIIGFTVLLAVVVFLPFFPERATNLVFPTADDENIWYFTGGIYIGMVIGFYAFILSFINLLSIGFSVLNFFNSIRGKIRKGSSISTPTKQVEPFSRFHPEILAPLLVNILALFWSSFNLNLIIRDTRHWNVHLIWQVSSNVVLFLVILVHIYFITQKSAFSIEIRKEEARIRGSIVSLIPLLTLFLIEFVVPEAYWESNSFFFILYLAIICTLLITTTAVKTTISWRIYFTYSSVFFFCSMTWFTLQPEFVSFSFSYLLILTIVTSLIGLHLLSGYATYPFNLIMIVALNVPHLTFLFQPTISVVLLALFGFYVVYYEGSWLIFQQHMSTEARTNVLIALAMKPSSRIDSRKEPEIQALEELIHEGIVERISDSSHQRESLYKIKSKKWEIRLSEMAVDKEWLDDISKRE